MATCTQNALTHLIPCIGKTYTYSKILFYDGHKKSQQFKGTCIGIDPSPPGKARGEYLVLRPHTDISLNHHLHIIPLKDVKELVNHEIHYNPKTSSHQ